MNVHPVDVVAAERRRLGRRVRIVAFLLAVAFVAGVAFGERFWRRQVQALARRAKPYVRRSSRVDSPALIINRWSGDGKAEKYGLADAAANSVSRPSCWSGATT